MSAERFLGKTISLTLVDENSNEKKGQVSVFINMITYIKALPNHSELSLANGEHIFVSEDADKVQLMISKSTWKD